MTDSRRAARRVEEELLGRLGLDRGANPLAVETARDGIVSFLRTAPAGLRTWADRQVSLTDEAYALLSDPTADLSAYAATHVTTTELPGPAAAALPAAVGTTPVRPTRRGLLGGLGPVGRAVASGVAVVAILAGVYAVYAAGSPSVPGMTGTPAPEASDAAAAAASPALDMALVGEMMQRISNDPADLDAYRQLMDAYFVAEDYASALTFAQKVVELDATSATAHLALGAAYYNTNDLANAETTWKRAIELDPANVEAHYDLGYLYLTKEPSEDAAAKAEWEKVLELAPDSELAGVVKTHLDSLVASPAPAGSATSGE